MQCAQRADGPAGTKYYMLADERGSIVAYADAAAKVVQQNTYDGFGRQKPWNDGFFRYTGQTWVDELALYHYKARFYDADSGRFLQTNPVGYGDQMNMYAYVANDPINLSDPSGMFLGVISKAFKLIRKGGDIGATFAGAAQDVGTLFGGVVVLPLAAEHLQQPLLHLKYSLR